MIVVLGVKPEVRVGSQGVMGHRGWGCRSATVGGAIAR